MKKDITNWISSTLYPTLFEYIDSAFPEHNFKRGSEGWTSNTYLNGEPHQRGDKTKITKRVPNRIFEQGGESLTLIDYVIKRDIVEFIEATKTLARVVGLELPSDSEFDREAYLKREQKATILELSNSYFTYSLLHAPQAKGMREYLANRGYTTEDIKAMELGFIPSQRDLFKELQTKGGYSQSLINESIKLHKGIGSTHQLSLPYRSGGSVEGFVVRTIGDFKPKYLVSTGLKRGDTLFNLSTVKGDKDIVIVEGYLDALIATAKGMDNVVGLGSAKITIEEIKDALRRGAKKFTLCLDADKGGKEGVKHAIEALLREGVNRIYVVNLPETKEKIDPDTLIKEEGIEAFKEIIANSIPYYDYKLQLIIREYQRRDQEEAFLSSKEIDSLLDEAIETAYSIPYQSDKESFIQSLTLNSFVQGLGITEQRIKEALESYTDSKAKRDQDKELRNLLTKATSLQSKGDTAEAIELIEKELKEVKQKAPSIDFSKLLHAPKEEDIRERFVNKPESLHSGYTIGLDEERLPLPLLLPSGALSIIAAPTSHGKTTFLINLALNVVERYKDKQAHLFSFEEDSDSVLMSALSTYIGKDVSKNNRKSIKDYFATGSNAMIGAVNRDYFIEKKNEFFNSLISSNRLNIHYCNYDSDTLVEAIRYLHKHSSVGSIFIDYIQLINPPQGKYKTYSRQEEVKQICIDLKDVSIETGLPIILGAQFNREAKNQYTLHPTNIGEAGDIERVANLIVAFWNNNFKPAHKSLSSKEEDQLDKAGHNVKGTLYATILKNRAGVVGGEEALLFNGNVGTIKNGCIDREEEATIVKSDFAPKRKDTTLPFMPD